MATHALYRRFSRSVKWGYSPAAPFGPIIVTISFSPIASGSTPLKALDPEKKPL
jgi:hypothetical protein